MNSFDDSSVDNFYQFPSWSTSLTRSHTILSSKTTHNRFKLRIDNRSQFGDTSKQYLSRQNVRFLTESSRIYSPPPLHQPTPTPDLCSTIDQASSHSSNYQARHLTPIRVKSAMLTVPIKSNSEETLSKNFPKQIHERRKIMQDRLRQKQLTQRFVEADTDTWFQLRESLAELKRLAKNDELLVDPTTSIFNCDGFSFEALKQVVDTQLEGQKVCNLKYESGKYQSINSTAASNIRLPTKLRPSKNPLSHSQLKRRSTETYPHSAFEPLVVAAKPIHSLLLNTNTHSSKTTKRKQAKPPATAPARVRSPSPSIIIPSISEKYVQLLTSNLSTNDDPRVSSTPSPDLQNIRKEDEEKPSGRLISQTSNCSEVLSSVPLKSKIKLKPQVPRCHSAMEMKCSFLSNKNYPRFILITDEEHRIESWYHQYPFILSDDLLQSFQSKPNNSTISAYFIDDNQHFLNSNVTTKTFLQGKLFHINNDWKKYDLIFISNNIYQQIIIYLQTIIDLTIKSSGKIIHIYQINHHQDLKTQVRYICKQLNQRFCSHD
ncbi:unnamed protein product [Rotaria socialis]|uniref:Uncharacterized protein n=1 Tax=Rotaria socialis TaxID=392032 RepID=A0A819BI20_9BILA|nr:unnamed protein product [Rotaria socialis]